MVFCDHLLVLPVGRVANAVYKEAKTDKGDEWQFPSEACRAS